MLEVILLELAIVRGKTVGALARDNLNEEEK